MILHEASVPFGGKVTDIVTGEFKCVVSTAKEGVFKGLSTMVADVQAGEGRPCAKIVYARSTRKRERLQFHEIFVAGLDEAGERVRRPSLRISAPIPHIPHEVRWPL